MHCPDSFPQIDRDLSAFPNVDPDRIAQEIPQRFGQRQSLCHYTVKDNKVFQAYTQYAVIITQTSPQHLFQISQPKASELVKNGLSLIHKSN